MRFGCQDLIDVDPAMGKRVGTTCQVQTPDAQGFLWHHFRCGFQIVFQTLTPMLQRARVMQTQAFDIDHFQPSFADLGGDH